MVVNAVSMWLETCPLEIHGLMLHVAGVKQVGVNIGSRVETGIGRHGAMSPFCGQTLTHKMG